MGALKYFNTTTQQWEYIDQPGGANSFVYKEAITGVNGTQTTFTTARGYIPGTLQVFVNGLAQGPTHIVETSPSLGTFTLDAAPASGDVVTVNYQMNIPPHGNADTLDGFHASVAPAPSSIPVLNSNGQTGEWWEELGRSDVVISNQRISVPITPKRYMKVLLRVGNSAGNTVNAFLRANNAVSNHANKYIAVGTTSGTVSATVSTTASSIMAINDLSQWNMTEGEATLIYPQAPGISVGNGVIGNGTSSRQYTHISIPADLYPVTSFDVTVDGAGVIFGEVVVLGHD